MSDDKEEETKKIDSILEEKKKPGRPVGSKNKIESLPSRDDHITLLIEEMESLRSELKETKKKVEENERKPVSVRLENRKKKCNLPPYSGPMKRIKFMRNDQPRNPMTGCLIKVVYNAEKDRKELLDWRPPKGGLVPGKIYEVPAPVEEFLNSRSSPVYGERADPENPNQTKTVVTGEDQRCYCVSA